MARHHKSLGPSYYDGIESRSRMEKQDGGMISEDHSAVANLPQNVMMKPWPKAHDYLPENLDDTIRGIDRQIGEDHSKNMKHFKPKKV